MYLLNAQEAANKVQKAMGPKTEPWGTPQGRDAVDEA